jgi:hypothetical protein
VQHIEQAMDYQEAKENTKDKSKPASFDKSARKSRGKIGIYLTLVYLFVKLLFIVNLVLQFVILNWFLGPNYTFWGFGILRDLLYGIEWESSGHFPRVTLCDFEVRRLGNLHRWTVQCVLMLNMFSEKIYLFLWWWFLVVLVLTVCNFLYWIVVSVSSSSRTSFVQRYLTYKQIDGYSNTRKVQRFVDEKLRPDGVFVLRLISDNAGDIVTSEIVAYLWQHFSKKEDDANESFTAHTPSSAHSGVNVAEKAGQDPDSDPNETSELIEK